MADSLGRVLVAHPGAELYGSDRVMLASIEVFVANGADVLVALPHEGPLVPEIRNRGAHVAFTTMPVLRKAVLRPRGLFRFAADASRGWRGARRILRTFRPHVVYTSTLTIPLWIALSRLERVPVVSHVHEAEASMPLLVRRALTAPQFGATVIVANSCVTADVLRGTYGALRKRAEVVLNAVPGPPAVTPARDVLTSPLRLLYVGRLSPRKGVGIAVEAAAALVARGVDLRLQLLGGVFSGYEQFELDLRERIAVAGLQTNIELLGFQSDVWQHLADADVVLVPSVTDESFGNVVVEAVQAARPTVITEIKGLCEAADGYASVEIVPPSDAVAIANAVERIMAEWPLRREQALRDAQLARHRHGSPAYAERLMDVLRRVEID